MKLLENSWQSKRFDWKDDDIVGVLLIVLRFQVEMVWWRVYNAYSMHGFGVGEEV